MATILNQQDPNNPNNQQTGQQAPGSSAPSTTGSQQSQPAAKGTARSGQFQNFQSYMGANQQAGQRIGNLLSSSVGQQARGVQATSQSSQQQEKAAQQNINDIQQGIGKIREAVQTNQGFGQFFEQPQQPDQNNPVNLNLATPYKNIATGTTQLPQLQQQTTDIFNQAQIQQQNLQNRQQLLNNEQGRFQMLRDILGKSGRYSNPAARLDQALLQTNTNQLGNLMQNTKDVVGHSQQQIGAQQLAIQKAYETLSGQSKSALNELQGTDQQPGLIQQGLTNVDTALTQQQTEALKKRQDEIKDITQQFREQSFSQDIANQLGLSEGSTLFNVLGQKSHQEEDASLLTDEDKAYASNARAAIDAQIAAINEKARTNTGDTGIRNEHYAEQIRALQNQRNAIQEVKKYKTVYDDPENFGKYVNLADPNGIQKQNVINQQQLEQYAALQKLANKDVNEFAYKGVGTVDPSYVLQSDKFKQDLSDIYRQRADEAEKGSITGSGTFDWYGGLLGTQHYSAAANRTAQLKDLIDYNTIRNAAENFQNVQNTAQQIAQGEISGEATKSPSAIANAARGASLGARVGSAVPVVGTAIGGLIGGALGLVSGADFWNSIGGYTSAAGGQASAERNAAANLQGKWQEYLASRGYSDTAHIRDLINKNIPTGIQG